MTTTAERLAANGVALPRAQTPLAQHLPVIVSRGLAFVSGHGPMDSDRAPVWTGAVGSERTEEDGYQAARLSMLNALASLQAAIGDLDRVTRAVRITGMVFSAPGFNRQPWVTDGASELLIDVFGDEIGPHARTSVGVASSALDLTCTIESIFEVDLP